MSKFGFSFKTKFQANFSLFFKKKKFNDKDLPSRKRVIEGMKDKKLQILTFHS
jgi:hypothetical protein